MLWEVVKDFFFICDFYENDEYLFVDEGFMDFW